METVWRRYLNTDGNVIHGYYTVPRGDVPVGYVKVDATGAVRYQGKLLKKAFIATMVVGTMSNRFPDETFDKLKPAKEHIEKNYFIWKLEGE